MTAFDCNAAAVATARSTRRKAPTLSAREPGSACAARRKTRTGGTRSTTSSDGRLKQAATSIPIATPRSNAAGCQASMASAGMRSPSTRGTAPIAPRPAAPPTRLPSRLRASVWKK